MGLAYFLKEAPSEKIHYLHNTPTIITKQKSSGSGHSSDLVIRIHFYFYATVAYIRHFIFAGCYDNDPWYLVTNFAGHLDFAGHLELAGFYFSNAPLILNAPLNLLLDTRYKPSFSSCDGGRPNFKYIDFASV
jgi:hypothetical protein